MSTEQIEDQMTNGIGASSKRPKKKKITGHHKFSLTEGKFYMINDNCLNFIKGFGNLQGSLRSPGGFKLMGGEAMNLKLYVGNIPFEASEEDLKKLFSEVGPIQSVRIVTNAYSGRSRGFGFVEMTSSEDAQKAISMLNGKTLMDRALTVNEAKAQKKRGGEFRGREDRSR